MRLYDQLHWPSEKLKKIKKPRMFKLEDILFTLFLKFLKSDFVYFIAHDICLSVTRHFLRSLAFEP